MKRFLHAVAVTGAALMLGCGQGPEATTERPPANPELWTPLPPLGRSEATIDAEERFDVGEYAAARAAYLGVSPEEYLAWHATLPEAELDPEGFEDTGVEPVPEPGDTTQKFFKSQYGHGHAVEFNSTCISRWAGACRCTGAEGDGPPPGGNLSGVYNCTQPLSGEAAASRCLFPRRKAYTWIVTGNWGSASSLNFMRSRTNEALGRWSDLQTGFTFTETTSLSTADITVIPREGFGQSTFYGRTGAWSPFAHAGDLPNRQGTNPRAAYRVTGWSVSIDGVALDGKINACAGSFARGYNLVLAHEFGHALGIAHYNIGTSNVPHIMQTGDTMGACSFFQSSSTFPNMSAFTSMLTVFNPNASSGGEGSVGRGTGNISINNSAGNGTVFADLACQNN